LENEWAIVGAAQLDKVWFRVVVQPRLKQVYIYAIDRDAMSAAPDGEGLWRERLAKIAGGVKQAGHELNDTWDVFELTDAKNNTFSRYRYMNGDWEWARMVPYDEMDEVAFARLVLLAGDFGTPFRHRKPRV